MTRLTQDLKTHVEGEVLLNDIEKQVYSVDASIYQITPKLVVIPQTKDDLLSIVLVAKKHKIPLIPRGAATGIAGGCIGKGIVIDLSKNLNTITQINPREAWADVEPGVVQDQLNKSLSPIQSRLGPDTSTGNRATIGGMIGNNSSGAHSLRFGRMSEHIIELEVVLSSGEIATFKELNMQEWNAYSQETSHEGRIYRQLARIRREYGEEIKKHFPKHKRRASGYNLDELIRPEGINVAKLIAGSEGTLGLVASAKLKISPKPLHTALIVLYFHSRTEGFWHAEKLIQHELYSLEIIDEQLIQLGLIAPNMQGKLEWIEGSPVSMVVAELDANALPDLEDKILKLTEFVEKEKIGYSYSVLRTPDDIAHVWELRKAGLGLLMSRRTKSQAIAFVEDVSVPPHQLGPFMERFLKYIESEGKEAGFYGHMGEGCIHVRPYVDMTDPEDYQRMKRMIESVGDLLLEHEGVLSGEHGDGLVRSWTHPKMFGPKLYQAFCEIKEIFDPDHLMNPGKIVDAPDFFENLRNSPQHQVAELDTFLDFTPDGGLSFAVNMCNGNGNCRKQQGLMCPSFQAYGDERHSTRARAQALRAVVNGQVSLEALTQNEVLDVLDLCLECKGCKRDCPSHVDMARIKAEVLHQQQKKKGSSLRTKIFAHVGQLNMLQSYFPKSSRFFQSSSLSKYLLKRIGIAPERELPQIALETFSKVNLEQPKQEECKDTVVLFNDTFTEFNCPEIGVSAVQVLNSLGFHVIIPPWRCCGRPMFSKGLLTKAQKLAKNLVAQLLPYAKKGYPILGLEPSCLYTIIDDYPHLMPKEECQTVIDACLTFDAFLDSLIEKDAFPVDLGPDRPNVKLHRHCYQKALEQTPHTLNVLKHVFGNKASEIPSGCCGMAGSFGYESEHYDMSIAIANKRLVPAIKNSPPSSTFVANGMSCRGQN